MAPDQEPTAPLSVRREVELDLDVAEAWRLIATAEGWQEWMVDSADVEVAPGAAGAVVDDGVLWRILVDEVGERHVRFVWSDDDGAGSRVELALEATEDGRARILITEEWPAAACADCPLRASGRWDLRACLLCLRQQVACRA